MYFFAVCKGNSAGILSIEIVNETTNYRMGVQDILNFLGEGGGGEFRWTYSFILRQIC